MNSRELWLQERKTYVGGSDLGAILGINPYRSCLDVYLEKTSEGVVEETQSQAAYWGNVLEDVVAGEYSKRTGYKIEKPAGLIRHAEHSYIACNLDYWVINSDGRSHILECKTANQAKAQLWGIEGTNDIPQSYQFQVGYYAAITGVERVDIAVLIGGQDFRIYTYNKNKKTEGKLIKVAQKFWNEHVLKNIPPKPKNDQDAAKLYPKGNGLEVRADEDVLLKLSMLQDLKARKVPLEDEIEHLQLDIKEYMKEGELLIDDGGNALATWKNKAASKRLDTKKLKEEHADIYQQYLKEGKGSRVFTLK